MSEISTFITDNGLLSTLLGAAILGAVGWIYATAKTRRERNAIFEFLRASQATSEYKFRSTEAIASAMRFTEARVEELCSADPRIIRNSKEKQSWTLR